MNKVLENENKERNIQIHRSSLKMSTETKIWKIVLYLVNFIPLVLVFTQDLFSTDPETANLVKFTSSAVSIILYVFTELLSNILANHKEKAVLLSQLFESEITGRPLSKVEYDRELTNELYELAIRKGTLKKEKKYTGAYDVPQEIDDKYSYLFINRYIAAETRFLLNKLQIIFGILIAAVSVAFIFFLSSMSMTEAVYYIVCFWSVFIPVVRNFAKCSKSKKQCMKLSADIDNYFAEGNEAAEKFNRFNAYVQGLSFEMRNNLVTLPKFLRWLFAYQIKVLDVGVTNRFIEAIYEYEYLVLQKKGMKAKRRKFEWISRNDKADSVSPERGKEIIRKAKQNTSSKKRKTAVVPDSDQPASEKPKTGKEAPEKKNKEPASVKPKTGKEVPEKKSGKGKKATPESSAEKPKKNTKSDRRNAK